MITSPTSHSIFNEDNFAYSFFDFGHCPYDTKYTVNLFSSDVRVPLFKTCNSSTNAMILFIYGLLVTSHETALEFSHEDSAFKKKFHK